MSDPQNTGRATRSSRYKKVKSHLKTSFIEALKDKYCSSDDDLQTAGLVIEFVSKPKNNSAAELGYLRNVVLNDCNLSRVGLPPSGLQDVCPNIVDLDISNNHLSCSDCLCLLSQLPNVKFYNISGNPLLNCQDALQQWRKPLPNVENLVLNRTGIRWKDILTLCSFMQSLKELHVCDNGYSRIDIEDYRSLNGIECLRLNGNQIKRWKEVWKFNSLPKLKSLVLSKNPLEDIFYCGETSAPDDVKQRNKAKECNQLISEIEGFLDTLMDSVSSKVAQQFEEKEINTLDPSYSEMESVVLAGTVDKVQSDMSTQMHIKTTSKEDQEEMIPFPMLSVLCVSETHLSDWHHLEALSYFPALTAVRLKGIKLGENLSGEERRKLFVASLPNIKHLNGSEVTISERDKSERHFVRYFHEKEVQPPIFRQLQKKHGKLYNLVDVDIGFGFQEHVKMDLIYHGQLVNQASIRVVEPVGRLRLYISRTIGLPIQHFQMFHNPCGEGHEAEDRRGEESQLEDLRLDSLPMSRYNFMDGDQIIIIDTNEQNRVDTRVSLH